MNDAPPSEGTSADHSELFASSWPMAQPAVYGYIYGLVGNRSSADDVLQEVAVTCMRRMHTFDRARSFTAWALGVARLEIFTHRRRELRLPIERHPGLEAAIGDPADHLDEALDRQRDALQECLGQVGAHQRRFLELRYVDERSNDEIAGELGLRPDSVKVMLSRIRTALRACIDRRIARSLSA
ncbi:MAG: sigma-70 family RNA polymerase sigma factor [Planctomycetes bacterium]|nr:sigma-70 family RNA polymerase sigma factor [Planctomycetota bacterium]